MKFSLGWLLLCVGAMSGFAAQAAPAGDQGDDRATIDRGAYLARAGDCMACHTAPHGKPYAGGLGIDSPYGEIYSSNITPDPDHGIGGWSEQQFADALRKGTSADGTRLYPAMPYPSYAKLDDRDVHALYAYFMHGVKPVAESPPATDLGFPFDQRWLMGIWNWMFTDDGVFHASAERSDAVNRGAYLVQGLGHCGSCHTPRGFAQQEKALDDSDDAYLSGANLNGWSVPDLRGDDDGHPGIRHWSEQEIVDYLATGRNDYAGVSGEMKTVVADSTSYLTEQDLHAMAAYLKSLAGENAGGAPSPGRNAAESGSAKTAHVLTRAVDLNEGQRLYIDNCVACHQVSGEGAGRTIPRIAGNALANANDPTGLIHTILAGAAMPSTPGAPEALAMPNFDWRLSDEEVAALATFIRSGWDNHAARVTADQVAKVRATLPKRVSTSAPPPVKPRAGG